MSMKSRKIVGLTEEVTIYGNNKKKKTYLAKVDTGATKGSLDVKIAADLNLGPVIKSKLVKTAHGNKLRPVVEIMILFANKRRKAEFTLADRSHMRYHVLIGRNMLTDEHLIDPQKKGPKT